MHERKETMPDEIDIEFVHMLDPHLRLVNYEGTAAQLDAEGLIPAGFEWPSHVDPITWEADGFTHRLVRMRPRSFEGSKRAYLAAAGTVDNWQLSVRSSASTLPRRPIPAESSPAPYMQLAVARADLRFRAFVARVPGLARALGYGRAGRAR